MGTALRPRTLVLFMGDLLAFAGALWLSLFLRSLEVPSWQSFVAHLAPFTLLFTAWVVVFFIAGLYESRTVILARRALSGTLLVAQIINVSIAALFFFVVPLSLFGIAPKTLLLIYLFVSFLLILAWRGWLHPALRRPEPAVVVGSGKEVEELVAALRAAHRAPARVVAVLPAGTPASIIEEALERSDARIIIADFSDKRVAEMFHHLYNYLARGVRFFDALELYEEVFGRIALSRVDERWIARNVSRSAHLLYDPLKRLLDMVTALLLGAVSLIAYPFIAAAVKFQDWGVVFVSLPRVGQDGRVIRIWKFRSMTGNDEGAYGESGASKLAVTHVGATLRVLRLDELPQLWNVLRGDLSLIGPRPETPTLVAVYEKHIPYYGLRHVIKPGLSGWAQLYHDQHPHAVTDVDATRDKLSYDLYYLKHRSLLLDTVIILKTIKKLLTRSGI